MYEASSMLDTRKPSRAQILRWAQRTPVHTFVMCPLLVIAFELALSRGRLTVVPSGAPLLAWGCDAATRRGGTTSPGAPDSKRTRALKTGEKYDEST
jgi:hypothetical protein